MERDSRKKSVSSKEEGSEEPEEREEGGSGPGARLAIFAGWWLCGCRCSCVGGDKECPGFRSMLVEELATLGGLDEW